MAPIKFEEHIKEKLEDRRIEPSMAGWERISGQLEMQQGKKRSKRVLWMSIAASFVIGVGLAALFLQENTTAVSPVVDASEQSNTQEDLEYSDQEAPIPIIDNQIEEEQVVDVIIPTRRASQETKATLKKQQTQNPKPESYKPQPNRKRYQEAVAVQEKQTLGDKSSSTINDGTKTSMVNELDIAIAAKVEAVVAAVDIKESVTDQEIEELLLSAQREIISKQLRNEIGGTSLDANALLLDAEYAVDPDTFKDKVFKSIKKEFNKAIEAVANKDN